MSDSNDNPKSDLFQPKRLDSGSVEVKAFRPRSLSGQVVNDYQQVKQQFGSLANTDAASNGHFNLHPASKKLLGVEREERSHVEGVVQAEVEERIARLKDEAFASGFEQGRKEGHEAALSEHRVLVQPMHDQLVNLLTEFDQIKKDLFAANESFLIQLMFQIGKQVILKDLSADRDYVKRLMTHVVEKVGAKDNIRIKVSRQDGENLEQLKEFLKAQLPDLKNVQIEASDEMVLGGCKVETDLSRINASIETQLGSIEKAIGDA